MTALGLGRAARGFGGWPIFSLSLAALIAGSGVACAGTALPAGGKVAAGSATISKSGSSAETIDQTSGKAIIDWSSFSVGKGGKVTFDNGSGATLNEVSGGSAAEIQGLLSGTGSVFVIDPAGVIIGRSGVVQTGGTFVAATLEPSTSRFLAGAPMVYAGKSTAQVVNLGRIGSLGGDVALIGLTVANHGQVSAARGDVGLLAGSQVVVRDRLLNDGKFEVVLGAPGTSVTNTGLIQSAEAELRANGGNVYALAGNAGGAIEAAGVSSNDGKVFLVADGGTTVAHGQIDATTAGGSGGQVETSGTTVNFDGASVRAGDWLIDPYDLTVNALAATTISNNLATTNVTLKTTASGASGPGKKNPAGVGDIVIDAPISWSSDRLLTLDAYHSITVAAAVTVAGAGRVVLTSDDGGSGGTVSFALQPSGFSGSLSFTGAPGGGQGVTIDGLHYTLLYSMADLTNIDTTSLSGTYALAQSLDAGGTTYTAALIGSASHPFTGRFDGLGHTISNLTINGSGSDDVGLFAAASGPISSLGLVGGAVSGQSAVGDLVGSDTGTITNAFATSSVSGVAFFTAAGGLVGIDKGAITNSYATGVVTGDFGDVVGGLVGNAEGSITNSYATGDIPPASSSASGGLVGENTGTISASYATGAIDAGGGGTVGGLVGSNSGSISDSYATGAVGGSTVGGLVGYDSGTITSSHASGEVMFESFANTSSGAGGLVGNDTGTITNSFATGSVQVAQGVILRFYVGGLVGQNSGSISGSYATGAVDTTSVPSNDVGGLVGSDSGSITSSHATGEVFGAADVGGLVGQQSGGVITNDYATGRVKGATEVGGLVGGMSSTTITNSYASGAVSGFREFGGLVGLLDAGTNITNSFYDIDRVLIDGGHVVTLGGIYDGQYQDWLGHGLSLNIDNYFGSPDANGFYNITDLTDLENLLGFAEGAGLKFKLTGDIDLSSAPGFFIPYFVATLDGQGHTVSNPSVSLDSSNVGFIGILDGGSITNLGVVGGSVSSKGVNVGGLVGWDLSGSIANSYATDGVEAEESTGRAAFDPDNVGGLVGLDQGGPIAGSYASGAVSATGVGADVGGLVGYEQAASITSSYATGAVSESSRAWFVGGLVGGNDSASTIADSYATGAVRGDLFVGGLIGNNNGSVSDSHSTGLVTESRSYGTNGGIGGLAGNNVGAISGSYATGPVRGQNDVGGLVGANGGLVTDSYATGAVEGGDKVGGLVGGEDNILGRPSEHDYTTDTIDDSFATGAVTGEDDVGGLVGRSDHGVLDSYATGAVKGSSDVGGLVGALIGGVVTESYATGAVKGSADAAGLVGLLGASKYEARIVFGYYDSDTTGMPHGRQRDGSWGVTTVQLQSKLPAGFNGSAWATGPHLYPFLKHAPPGAPQN